MESIFIPFTKSDEEQRMVWGYASTEALDSQGEKVAKSAIEEALPDYMKFANIREMHQPSAVGKAHEATIDDKGLFLGVKVVDDTAWQKVQEGVYNGFSIGGKRITKVNDTITKLKLTEISLVDRPANPEAVFTMFKGEDMADEEKKPKDEEVEGEEDTKSKPKKKEDDNEAEKADNQLDLLKGYLGEEVWDVSRALGALDAITCLLAKEISEEEKMPEQVSALQTAIKAIKAFIVSEIQEDNGSGESAEIAMSDGANDDISKAGASISAANRKKLEDIMAMCKEMMGDTEEAEKGEDVGDIKKSDDLAKAEEINMLKCDLEKANDEIAKMHKEIETLKTQPEAPKGVTKVISKGDDYGKGINDEKVSQAIVKKADGSIDEVASLIKAQHIMAKA